MLQGRTGEAIGALLNLTPPTAILLAGAEEGGGEAGGKAASEREVPTALIHRGDLLKVRASRCCLNRHPAAA